MIDRIARFWLPRALRARVPYARIAPNKKKRNDYIFFEKKILYGRASKTLFQQINVRRAAYDNEWTNSTRREIGNIPAASL